MSCPLRSYVMYGADGYESPEMVQGNGSPVVQDLIVRLERMVVPPPVAKTNNVTKTGRKKRAKRGTGVKVTVLKLY